MIIEKPDKGNTLIIMKNDDYNNKIESFINNNYFTILSCDITNKQQQNIRNYINNSKNIINPNNKWRYINMNPSAPHIYGTIKLHKQEKSIWPIVNWRDSPGYKLAKHLNTILNNTLQLSNAFNVRNTSILTHSLKLIEVNEDTRLC